MVPKADQHSQARGSWKARLTAPSLSPRRGPSRLGRAGLGSAGLRESCLLLGPSTGGWGLFRDPGGLCETQLSSHSNCFLQGHTLPETRTPVGTEPLGGRAWEPALESQGSPVVTR